MKYTFNQLAAAIVLAISLLLLCCCHDLSTTASDVLKGTAGLAAFFLWGSTAGSQAKDAQQADVHDKLITALKESAPPLVTATVGSDKDNIIQKAIDAVATLPDLDNVWKLYGAAIGTEGVLSDYFQTAKARVAKN